MTTNRSLTNSRMLRIPAAVLALAVLMTGCSQSTKSASSEGTSTTEGSAKLPDDFPKDVTVPKTAKITMATAVNNGPSVGFQVAYDLPASTDAIVAFLKKGLTDNGWTVNQTSTLSATLTSMGATKERRELNVQIVDADGKRSVTETVMGPKA